MKYAMVPLYYDYVDGRLFMKIHKKYDDYF